MLFEIVDVAANAFADRIFQRKAFGKVLEDGGHRIEAVFLYKVEDKRVGLLIGQAYLRRIQLFAGICGRQICQWNQRAGTYGLIFPTANLHKFGH